MSGHHPAPRRHDAISGGLRMWRSIETHIGPEQDATQDGAIALKLLDAFQPLFIGAFEFVAVAREAVRRRDLKAPCARSGSRLSGR